MYHKRACPLPPYMNWNSSKRFESKIRSSYLRYQRKCVCNGFLTEVYSLEATVCATSLQRKNSSCCCRPAPCS
ncbi:unnamed protein product [Lactuca virosa]|uniref:Uncharacterized protein n=1 Tax=Lactuca virosa TaxID=75947 RepID=A0AAU9NL09_9ASTR|nr:unnamed protein product [Lactuca virosa]